MSPGSLPRPSLLITGHRSPADFTGFRRYNLDYRSTLFQAVTGHFEFLLLKSIGGEDRDTFAFETHGWLRCYFW
jgi:hypothetical protein